MNTIKKSFLLICFFVLLMCSCYSSTNFNESHISSDVSTNDSVPDDFDIEDEYRLKICAWRGCYEYLSSSNCIEKYCEENSWPSYYKAIENKFDYLWIASVNYSKDGVFYVMHDNNTRRTCSINYEVREEDSSVINNLSLNNIGYIDWQENDLKIPRLEDVLKFCINNKIKYGIRLGWLPDNYFDYPKIWDSALKLFEKYHINQAIYSGTYNQISIIKERYMDWNCQVVADKYFDLISAINYVNNFNTNDYSNMSIVFYRNCISSELVELLHCKNIKIFLLIDFIIDKETLEYYKSIKIDYLITSYYIKV